MPLVEVNGRWPLDLPEHRAARPEWPWWEAIRLGAMHAHIRPGECVWDVGAEEGDLSALWALWGASTVLIEPNPAAWPCIREVHERNGLVPWRCVHGFAAEHTNRPDRVDRPGLEEWPAAAAGPMVVDHGFYTLREHGREVGSVSLDGLASTGVLWPDHVTMDVEGYELTVLKGAEGLLANRLRGQPKRPVVWVSVHRDFMADLGVDNGSEQLRGLMASHGYSERYLAHDHEAHWCFWHPDEHVMLWS